MMLLERNIRALCKKHGLDFDELLEDMDVQEVNELTVFDLEALAEEYEVDLQSLLFKSFGVDASLRKRLDDIKLLVLDVDGVMTDGGMYFTEEGKQIKKYNTKDGMAILAMTKADFQVAIISSGFNLEIVKHRSDMLGIQHCVVTRASKMSVLQDLIGKLDIQLSQVAMIGDDINDSEIMRAIGISACPSDAVQQVKNEVDIILSTAGGNGCVREFIDYYLLNNPIAK